MPTKAASRVWKIKLLWWIVLGTKEEDHCTYSTSLFWINDEMMISCVIVNWMCYFLAAFLILCTVLLRLQWNTKYPIPSHFQFLGRDGSGTWKKVRDRSGTGIPSGSAWDLESTRRWDLEATRDETSRQPARSLKSVLVLLAQILGPLGPPEV